MALQEYTKTLRHLDQQNKERLLVAIKEGLGGDGSAIRLRWKLETGSLHLIAAVSWSLGLTFGV